jgi:hypothetical protein
MIRRLGIAGSWRGGSYNLALLHAAAALAPADCELDVVSIRGFSVQGDVRRTRILCRADIEGVHSDHGRPTLGTPSTTADPRPPKNTTDWFTRPPRSASLQRSTCIICGVSQEWAHVV